MYFNEKPFVVDNYFNITSFDCFNKRMIVRSELYHKMSFWEANEMLNMLFGSVRKNGTEMTWLVVIKNPTGTSCP